jgi:hypothetical protein
LLLEPTSSNAITYSEDFSQTSFWNANSNVTILKNYKSPDGTLNASKIIPNTTNSQHSIKATGKLTNSRYNYTIYVKASGNSFFQIANQSTSDYVNFNLNNGTYFASNSNDEVSVDYFGDGWYRCNVYFATTFQGIYNVIIENIGSTRLESFVGNDVDGIYIWGAQAEVKEATLLLTYQRKGQLLLEWLKLVLMQVILKYLMIVRGFCLRRFQRWLMTIQLE